ncbi:hypothetical protein HMPREF9166_2234 [Selenomonas sp. oral taxon 149 str. 67H29BP]|nr:hypothetical protein HMPREF9166_2234 [Selenomonas sp. oral taxon 149 str. 67H29BP]
MRFGRKREKILIGFTYAFVSCSCIFLSVLTFYRFLEENARSKGT